MTNDHEPPVRELTPAEIEALRQEMGQSIEWAQAELARRRVVALLSPDERAELRRNMAEASAWMRAELVRRRGGDL
ncbi:MAG: hypothetical protein VB141_11805 [Burkholderia gladioli]